jgi:hypothetical protein
MLYEVMLIEAVSKVESSTLRQPLSVPTFPFAANEFAQWFLFRAY